MHAYMIIGPYDHVVELPATVFVHNISLTHFANRVDRRCTTEYVPDNVQVYLHINLLLHHNR